MAIHLYLDAALTQPLSKGDGSRPDAENEEGLAGDWSLLRHLLVSPFLGL